MGGAVFPPSCLTWHQTMVEIMKIMMTSFNRSCTQCPNPAAKIWQQIFKTQQWPQDQKRSVFIQNSKKCNAKECSNYPTITLISHASKIMLKISHARLQQYMNHEVLDVQAGFRKGKGTRDQIANICWIIKKAREFQKNTYFCFIDYIKTFDYTTNCGKFLKRWDYQTIWPASWEICMQSRINS